MRKLLFLVFLSLTIILTGQDNTNTNLFRQLGTELPSPNNYRTASGAPGHEYWQQRADYVIEVELDEEDRELTGEVTITYTNGSPDTLRYLWLNMDQNRFAGDSMYVAQRNSNGDEKESYGTLKAEYEHRDGNYGFRLAQPKTLTLLCKRLVYPISLTKNHYPTQCV